MGFVMNFISDRLKYLFIPIVILSLIFVFLYNDLFINILMEHFAMVNIIEVNGLFNIMFVLIFVIYILIPFLNILSNRYGNIFQRVFLTLSIISCWIIYIFLSGFDTIAMLYALFLAIFLNFTSKIFKLDPSYYIISNSSLNILLMVYISIFLLVFYHTIYPYWVPIVMSFLFVVSSIIYSEKVL